MVLINVIGVAGRVCQYDGILVNTTIGILIVTVYSLKNKGIKASTIGAVVGVSFVVEVLKLNCLER